MFSEFQSFSPDNFALMQLPLSQCQCVNSLLQDRKLTCNVIKENCHIIIYGKTNLGLLWTELWPSSWPNSYVAALTPNVPVFGDGAYQGKSKVK